VGKLFIVHFQPLELYPPVMNLVRFIAEQQRNNVEVHIISTASHQNKKIFAVKGIVIHRIGKWKKQWSKWQRIFFYLQFNLRALLLLLKHRPSKVMYYETLSAGAPCLYRRFFNRGSELYIHFHEYTSPEEYDTGMFLNRLLYKLERYEYGKAVWVSHTNEYRLKMFVKDAGDMAPVNVYTTPNYPTRRWQSISQEKKKEASGKVSFVYVGALSLETMYVEAFADFISQYPDKYSWDIYSDNFTAETALYFQKKKASNIRFLGAIEYDQLPLTLPDYDIGIVLYKGHIPNYIYNAPNKIFEYLACGLDVWFPQEMTGSIPYVTEKSFPEILQVDFKQLSQVKVLPARFRKGYYAANYGYFYENHISDLIDKLLYFE
jgi:hypothetical protein